MKPLMQLHSPALLPCLLAAALLTVQATDVRAATYYVSASTGSDTYNGRTPATAWKSRAKVSAQTFAPGDSVLFRRGDTWKEVTLLSLTESGTAAQPIFFGAYGSGARPVLADITPLTGWSDPTKWSARAPNIWALHYSETPNRIWLDGTEALRAPIAQDVGTTNTQGFFEWWYFNTSDSTLLVYAKDNPARAYASIEGTRPAGVLALYGCAYIVFDGIDFRGGRWTTIYGGACSHITFRDCAIGFGQTGLQLTSSDPARSSHDVLVEHCLIGSGADFRYGMSSLGTGSAVDCTKRGSEDGIHFGNAVHDCIVRACTFTGWGHVAVNCYAPDSTYDGVYRNTFADNTFTGANLSYTRPFATDGAEGKCHRNEFRGNIIRDHSVRCQVNGNDNRVHNNIFDGMTTSPAKYFGTDGSGQAIGISVYGQQLVCHDNRFENNLFIHTAEAAFTLWSYSFPNRVRNNRIRNNIFVDCGNATALRPDSGTALLVRDTALVFDNEFRSNCFFRSAASPPVIKFYGVRMSVDQFNASSGRLGTVIGGNIAADPLLRDASGRDYHLTAASPCIDAGVVIPDITRDLDGNAVFSGLAPDIGPYEHPGTSGIRTPAPITVRSTVHPQPAAGTAVITLERALRRGTLELHDIRGRVVLERRDLAGDTFIISTAQLPRGSYLYTITESDRITAAGMLLAE